MRIPANQTYRGRRARTAILPDPGHFRRATQFGNFNLVGVALRYVCSTPKRSNYVPSVQKATSPELWTKRATVPRSRVPLEQRPCPTTCEVYGPYHPSTSQGRRYRSRFVKVRGQEGDGGRVVCMSLFIWLSIDYVAETSAPADRFSLPNTPPK